MHSYGGANVVVQCADGGDCGFGYEGKRGSEFDVGSNLTL